MNLDQTFSNKINLIGQQQNQKKEVQNISHVKLCVLVCIKCHMSQCKIGKQLVWTTGCWEGRRCGVWVGERAGRELIEKASWRQMRKALNVLKRRAKATGGFSAGNRCGHICIFERQQRQQCERHWGGRLGWETS